MQTSNLRPLVILLLVALSLTMVASTSPAVFPDVIRLPNGFQPEGIASGDGTSFYVGSIPTGAVYLGDLRTGQGSVLVQPQAGRQAIGLKYDPRTGYLFVAGGPTGYAYVYDGHTGANVAAIQLTTAASFINDVVITEYGAYFTNSFQPVLYRVPLDSEGQLVDSGTSEEISLGGEYQFTPGAFNANGIAATPDGEALIIVNSAEGALYRVDPATGLATRIDLGSDSVTAGDGILLQGKTLYVVRNALNQVAVIKLDPSLSTGSIAATLTSPNFRVPTTIARFGASLYVVNARFGTPSTPDTEYEVVRVPE
jgi:sugar lactone lactonase YvrE